MTFTSDATPLEGRSVLVTRTPLQSSDLAEGLRRLGATPILIPTIEIAPPSSFAELDAAIQSIAKYDLVVFTSANAVRAFAERRTALGCTSAPQRIAVVGPATARAVEAISLRPDIMPATYTAESLGMTLAPEVRGRRILLLLAEDAPPLLASALQAAGAQVKIAAAYSNRIPPDSAEKIATLLSNDARLPHAVTFTSASTATHLVALLQSANVTLPECIARFSIGPVTSQSLRNLGLPPHAEAADATIPSLLQTIAIYLQNRQ